MSRFPVRSKRTHTNCRLTVESLEKRIVLSTITWKNLDALAAFEDPSTPTSEEDLARNVLLEASNKWANVVKDFNYENPPSSGSDLVLKLKVEADGNNCSATAKQTKVSSDGKPRKGKVTLQFCDQDGVPGTDWWFDPTPSDNAEFTGGITNAFRLQGNVPGRDLLSLMVHEIGHVMGFADSLYGKDVSSSVQIFPGPLNTVSPAPDDVYAWFQGPSINAMLTEFDINGTAEDAKHTARPVPGNMFVLFDELPLYGSVDIMNGTGISTGRTLISNKAALILQDAYGYEIQLPETIETAHAVVDKTSKVLTVRGGNGDTQIEGVDQGPDSDTIAIERVGFTIRVSVDVDHDVPGTGNGQYILDQQDAFVTDIPIGEVNEIYVMGGDGDDLIEIGADLGVHVVIFGEEGADTIVVHDNEGTPIQVFGGTGSDTLIPMFNDEDSSSIVHFTGGDGFDLLGVTMDVDMTITGNKLCIGGEAGTCLVGNVELHDDIAVELTGGTSGNTLHGGGFSGTLKLNGEAGNDTLVAGNGGSILRGGTGNDRLEGGVEPNIYHGEAGTDTLIITGTFGDDNLVLDLTAATLEIAQLSMLDGVDQVEVSTPASMSLTVDGGSDNDTLDLNNSLSPALIRGSYGNDIIVGSSESDSIFGGLGKDTIFGGLGDDEIEGGDDSDELYGQSGADLLVGRAGSDTLIGGGGADTLLGYSGNDRLYGGFANTGGFTQTDLSTDELDGGTGDDQLYGDNVRLLPSGVEILAPGGSDRILGQSGKDSIFGSDGDDSIQGNGGNDLIHGGDGQDLTFGGSLYCEFTDAGPAGGSDKGNEDNQKPVFVACFDKYRDPKDGDPEDPIEIGSVPNTEDGADTIQGEQGADRILGDNWSELFKEHTPGGHGDSIGGGDKNDEVYGQTGDDTLHGDGGADFLVGGSGSDTINGGEASDSLFGQDENDVLNGEGGHDRLVGAEGDDTASGSVGSDTLEGGPGNDELAGGDGPDLISGDIGDDSMFGDAGDDTLQGGLGRDSIIGGLNDDRLLGGPGGDVMLGGDGRDVMFGQIGDDFMDGEDNDDELVGGLGSDTMMGGDGNDRMVGGALLLPDASLDKMAGEAGRDIIRGDSGPLDTTSVNSVIGGADVISGGGANDTILAMAGNDTVWGNAGDDEIYGGPNDNSLFGGNGSDLIRGGDHNDIIHGNRHNDILLGEGGNDIVRGGSGRDLVIGGRNQDELRGGLDDDLLIGATTTHDGNSLALLLIMTEWSSTRSHTHRVLNIQGEPNSSFSQRLNGSVFLIATGDNQTLDNDAFVDTLTGGSDQDWFILNPFDDLVDQLANELATLVP